MSWMVVTHFYSLIYNKGVSGCLIKNCTMVALVPFLSITMPAIVKRERNAKFLRKDTQHL